MEGIWTPTYFIIYNYYKKKDETGWLIKGFYVK